MKSEDLEVVFTLWELLCVWARINETDSSGHWEPKTVPPLLPYTCVCSRTCVHKLATFHLFSSGMKYITCMCLATDGAQVVGSRDLGQRDQCS